MNGAEVIQAERLRQIRDEGYTRERDQQYDSGELLLAAECYIAGDAGHWPWAYEYWKPTPDDRIRELAKAGALIAAEIDRLSGQISTPAMLQRALGVTDAQVAEAQRRLGLTLADDEPV